jgi:hypothetical protein
MAAIPQLSTAPRQDRDVRTRPEPRFLQILIAYSASPPSEQFRPPSCRLIVRRRAAVPAGTLGQERIGEAAVNHRGGVSRKAYRQPSKGTSASMAQAADCAL